MNSELNSNVFWDAVYERLKDEYFITWLYILSATSVWPYYNDGPLVSYVEELKCVNNYSVQKYILLWTKYR